MDQNQNNLVNPSPAVLNNQTPSSALPPQGNTPNISHATNAGTIVLGWLTYAFWGWTVLALSFLTSMVISSFLIKTGSEDSFTPYAIAAILVLLPISFVCDILYSKKEQLKKHGAEMVVMIIHAVIFAIFGVGALIVAVISVVRLMTSSEASAGILTVLISALIIALYYAITLVRTLNPPKFSWVRRAYRIFMLISIGVIGVLGIVGPVASERLTRDDRLISANLYSVNSSINAYINSKKALPVGLNDVTFSGDAKKLVDRGLVEYKSDGSSLGSSPYNLGTLSVDNKSFVSTAVSYKYQLCVNYKQKDRSANSRIETPALYDQGDGYATYLSTYGHEAGRVCYKLKVIGYSSAM